MDICTEFQQRRKLRKTQMEMLQIKTMEEIKNASNQLFSRLNTTKARGKKSELKNVS